LQIIKLSRYAFQPCTSPVRTKLSKYGDYTEGKRRQQEEEHYWQEEHMTKVSDDVDEERSEEAGERAV